MAVAVAVSVIAPAAGTAMAAPAAGTGLHTLAAKKNGFVKKSGKWYYYKKGKKVSGLNRISGHYYYFSKSGVMQSGKKTIDGLTWYFKKAKDGKAAALADREMKISGKKWYFSSTGKGFLSTGNKKGNQAVAKLIDGLKLKNSMNKKAKLQAAYQYILDHYEYMPADLPNLKNKNWIYSKAMEMVTEEVGKCYEYTAITALAAKALDYKVTVYTGRYKMNASAKDYTEHSWVVVDGKNILDSVRDDNNGKKGMQYFCRTAAQILDSEGTDYDYKTAKKFSI